jgi:hypothetical protein
MATRYSSTFGFLSLSAQPVPRGLVNDFVGWLVSSLNASAGRPKASARNALAARIPAAWSRSPELLTASIASR